MDATKVKTATLLMANLNCVPSIRHQKGVVSEAQEVNEKFDIESFKSYLQ